MSLQVLNDFGLYHYDMALSASSVNYHIGSDLAPLQGAIQQAVHNLSQVIETTFVATPSYSDVPRIELYSTDLAGTILGHADLYTANNYEYIHAARVDLDPSLVSYSFDQQVMVITHEFMHALTGVRDFGSTYSSPGPVQTVIDYGRLYNYTDEPLGAADIALLQMKLGPSSADDTIIGGSGTGEIFGGLGDDEIYGNQATDIIFGNQDDDWLHGGQGNDYVHGGQGDDIIWGGSGVDTLDGGLGADTIYYDEFDIVTYDQYDTLIYIGG